MSKSREDLISENKELRMKLTVANNKLNNVPVYPCDLKGLVEEIMYNALEIETDTPYFNGSPQISLKVNDQVIGSWEGIRDD